LRDIRKQSRNKQILDRIKEIIEEVESAETLPDIANLRRLTSEGLFYRIRFGEYRIGLVLEHDEIFFVSILHRREISRYFP
jgi:mRNA interferase RelE/StbE